jgi:hypothetical protein
MSNEAVGAEKDIATSCNVARLLALEEVSHGEKK